MPRQRLQARERRPKIRKVTVQMTVTEVSEENGREDTKRREEFKKTESVVHRESDAARTLQRAYRGYKSRRELQGFSLDPSTRWTEAIKEARYRALTTPRPRTSGSVPTASNLPRTASEARQNWLRVGTIARRAGGDDEDDSSSSSNGSQTPSQKQARREKRSAEKLERKRAAKMMDLQYFLEMVDLKHRYGSNLRSYHEEWKTSKTTENFFYWLDYGEGKNLSLQTVPRERLDREQVRYLSREERLNYLVAVDKEGRLCWKRNGQRIDTTIEWKDSAHGIVPVGDTSSTEHAQAAAAEAAQAGYLPREDGNITNSSSSADDRGDRYVNTDLGKSPRTKKVFHVSPATILNHLLRKTVKKNTWIFVADTNFKLYIGIKQSGSFQHSSFLHGSRISAAGLIKVKDGQIRSLSPLSGHYRPTSSSFRAFIKTLQARNVDMSAMTVSKSYAVLVGLEGYTKTKKKFEGVRSLFHHEGKKDKADKETTEHDLKGEARGTSAV